MTETNDYTPQLKKSIEWAKQTRDCPVCKTRTPHRIFSVNKNIRWFQNVGEVVTFTKTLVCGFCGHTEETK